MEAMVNGACTRAPGTSGTGQKSMSQSCGGRPLRIQRGLSSEEVRNLHPALEWWSSETVAVVTGANKGVGYEIARQLAHNGLTTVITARDETRGNHAVESLKQEVGSDCIAFHPLDVLSEDSATKFAHWLQQTYGGTDILINNAGVYLRPDTEENINLNLQTNYYGVKNVTKAVLPLLRHSAAGARLIMVSSGLGALRNLSNKFREELTQRDQITEEKTDHFVQTYLEAVRNGKATQEGWPNSYCVSKVALNNYMSILARELGDHPEGQKVYVNSFTPGYTKTEMTSYNGINTVEEGVMTGVWLALHPPGGPSGKFWADKNRGVVEF